MKLNPLLQEQIQEIYNLGYVLDIGFGYPYELIELLHLYNAKKCIGIETKKKENSVFCSTVNEEIAAQSGIDITKINNLISDEDSERELHNSYKLYTTLVLEKEPLDYSIYKKYLELRYEKSIQQYLNEDGRNDPPYDVIIASKVLSHINPEIEENGDWVLDRLISKLSTRSIIYLKLNSSDFPIGGNSPILHPFTDERLKEVKNKIELIYENTLIDRPDGKREYEIIGRKK